MVWTLPKAWVIGVLIVSFKGGRPWSSSKPQENNAYSCDHGLCGGLIRRLPETLSNEKDCRIIKSVLGAYICSCFWLFTRDAAPEHEAPDRGLVGLQCDVPGLGLDNTDKLRLYAVIALVWIFNKRTSLAADGDRNGASGSTSFAITHLATLISFVSLPAWSRSRGGFRHVQHVRPENVGLQRRGISCPWLPLDGVLWRSKVHLVQHDILRSYEGSCTGWSKKNGATLHFPKYLENYWR